MNKAKKIVILMFILTCIASCTGKQKYIFDTKLNRVDYVRNDFIEDSINIYFLTTQKELNLNIDSVRFADSKERAYQVDFQLMDDGEKPVKYNGYYLGYVSLIVEDAADFEISEINFNDGNEVYNVIPQESFKVYSSASHSNSPLVVLGQPYTFGTLDMRSDAYGFNFFITLYAEENIVIKSVEAGNYLKMTECYFTDDDHEVVKFVDDGYRLKKDSTNTLNMTLFLKDDADDYSDIQSNIIITYEVAGKEYKNYVKAYSTMRSYPDFYEDIVAKILNK